VGVQPTYVLIGLGMAAVSLRNRHILTETLVPAAAGEGRAKPATSPPATASGAPGWLGTGTLMLKDRACASVMLANAGFNVTSISSKFVLLPMLALDAWSFSASGLGTLLGSMSLLQFACAKPAAHVADIYGRKMALLPGLGLSAAAMALAASGIAGPLWTAPLVCGSWAVGTSLVGSVPNAVALDTAGRLGLSQEGTAKALAISRAVGDLGMVVGCTVSGVLLTDFGAHGAFGAEAGVLFLVAAITAAAWRA